jgi:hypothetical protein
VVIALVRVTIQTNLENSNEKIDSDLNQGKPSKRGFPLRNRQFETDVVRSKVSTSQRFDPAADEEDQRRRSQSHGTRDAAR